MQTSKRTSIIIAFYTFIIVSILLSSTLAFASHENRRGRGITGSASITGRQTQPFNFVDSESTEDSNLFDITGRQTLPFEEVTILNDLSEQLPPPCTGVCAFIDSIGDLFVTHDAEFYSEEALQAVANAYYNPDDASRHLEESETNLANLHEEISTSTDPQIIVEAATTTILAGTVATTLSDTAPEAAAGVTGAAQDILTTSAPQIAEAVQVAPEETIIEYEQSAIIAVNVAIAEAPPEATNTLASVQTSQVIAGADPSALGAVFGLQTALQTAIAAPGTSPPVEEHLAEIADHVTRTTGDILNEPSEAREAKIAEFRASEGYARLPAGIAAAVETSYQQMNTLIKQVQTGEITPEQFEATARELFAPRTEEVIPIGEIPPIPVGAPPEGFLGPVEVGREVEGKHDYQYHIENNYYVTLDESTGRWVEINERTGAETGKTYGLAPKVAVGLPADLKKEYDKERAEELAEYRNAQAESASHVSGERFNDATGVLWSYKVDSSTGQGFWTSSTGDIHVDKGAHEGTNDYFTYSGTTWTENSDGTWASSSGQTYNPESGSYIGGEAGGTAGHGDYYEHYGSYGGYTGTGNYDTSSRGTAPTGYTPPSGGDYHPPTEGGAGHAVRIIGRVTAGENIDCTVVGKDRTGRATLDCKKKVKGQARQAGQASSDYKGVPLVGYR